MQEAHNIYEKRLTERMKAFWETLRDKEDMPFSARFNGSMLGDIWESCLGVKVTVVEGKYIYQCDYEGPRLKKTLEKDFLFKYLNLYEKNALIDRNFLQSLEDAVNTRQIVNSSGQFVTDRGQILKYRDCILPFKKPDGKVSMLIVGISWKLF